MTRSFSFPSAIFGLWLTSHLPLCEAFAPQSTNNRVISINENNYKNNGLLKQSSLSQEPPSSSSSSNNNSIDSMKSDIEALRQEAQRRLDALTMDLEAFKSTRNSNDIQVVGRIEAEKSSTALSPDARTTAAQKKNNDERISNTSPVVPITKVILDQPVDVHLLDNTRWKIVFNLGREPGTWMPPAWGASGERLRFTVVVDLLDRPLDEHEDFLEGMAGAKKLRVVEAWLGPTFDNSYHGRRNLRVGPTGGYKVVRGAGPMNTDVFRFFVEMEETFRASGSSDAFCPRGRVYGNCGYFPTLKPEVRDSFHAYKDRLQKEYRQVANRYDLIQQEKEEDGRLISWDKITRAKEEMKLRNHLRELDRKIQEARQRDPDKAQLRLSRKGDVGLTKDGGVCCKVQKGLALEYHILGRMEIAAVELEHGDGETHEEYEDLVKKMPH